MLIGTLFRSSNRSSFAEKARQDEWAHDRKLLEAFYRLSQIAYPADKLEHQKRKFKYEFETSDV